MIRIRVKYDWATGNYRCYNFSSYIYLQNLQRLKLKLPIEFMDGITKE